MIKAFFTRNVYEPLYSSFYRRDRRVKYYATYRQAQWSSLEENRKLQAQRLYELIKYASENIPYYQKVLKKKNITFSRETIFEDIKKIPILTKDIMRKEFKDIYKIKDDVKWSYNSSGGSTGEPVKFIQDFDYAAHSDAMARLQYEWAGCKLGDLIIKLWGSEKDITKEKQSVRHIFANWVKSVYLLNSFLMDENKMKAYVDIINKKRPKLILAYAQSIYELAKFIEKNKLKVFAPGAIMTSAGTLYPSFRNTIESVFKCHVFNRYGSREVGAVACECEEHKGLHISIFTHYVEILNKYLQPCKEGETGRVYVTLLTNFTMPLIRYEIGDMAVFTQKKCSCKRGLPVLKDVVGRETDVFKTKDGRIIPGEFFIHFIGVVHNQGFISKFQVIQKDYDLIQIKLVLSSKQLFDKSKGKIEESIKKVMGEKCKIEFKIVKDIKSTKSGKYRYTTREF